MERGHDGRAGREPAGEDLASIVRDNIETLVALSEAEERRTPLRLRIADAITRFAGSMGSALFHFLLFGGWLLVNSGVVPWIEPFDPFPFVMLAMFASVEAIFLTTFVLVSQNRMGALQERRAKLELQVNLLAEHEATRLIAMVDAIAERVGVPRHDVEELKRDVRPEQVLDALDRAEGRVSGDEDERGAVSAPRSEDRRGSPPGR